MSTLERRPLPDTFLSKVEKIVGGRHVITDAEALEPTSHDAAPNLPVVLPDAWVRPASTAEVAAVVGLCAEHGVYVTPRGAGTGQSGGAIPLYGGVVLGLDRLTTIVGVDREDLVTDVQPGVVLQTLQEVVEEEGLFYPPDPASMQWCTLGGTVANNAGGPRALRYGVTRDYVLGLEVVLPTGEVIRTGKRTVKGVTGYDLTALMCGSEGTLGVITGMTLKLLPQPRAVQTALCVFDTSEAAARAVAGILASGLVPRTLEYMDRVSIEAVRQQQPPYRFPAGAGAALIVETDGDDEPTAFAQLMRALDVAQAAGALDVLPATDEAKRREIWESRRLLSAATRRIKKTKVSEDVVVPRSKIPEMVARVGALGERHGLMTCAFGHAGDGNLHVQVLFDDPATEMTRVEALLEDLFRQTIALGGTLTGEHGVGLSKQRFLGLEQSPELIALQRRLKAAFDPAGIMNPGKFLPPVADR
jgi:glycolate oxidase